MVRWLRKYFPRVGRQMNGFADAGEQRQYISTLSFTAKCNNDHVHDDEEEDNEYNNDDDDDVRVAKKDWFEDRRSSLMRPR